MTLSYYTCVSFICYDIVMVEAILYTQAPLDSEKNHVIGRAVDELCKTIERQDEKIDVIEHYIHQHLDQIKTYEANIIDFGMLLQRIQPLQTIPNNENNPNIEKLNSMITIINGLRDTTQHEIVFRWLCQNMQELIHPERMSLLQQFAYR